MSVRMMPGRTSKTGMPSPARRSAKTRAAMLRPAFEMRAPRATVTTRRRRPTR
ncbi:MAG: hypothetical protein MZV64_43025 [Ignavibacteriales bacterium]|nr:hypothetical protein [Ignavibacteriales bacterium]